MVQACRGRQIDQGVRVVDMDNAMPQEEADGGATFRIPTQADFLIAYSTAPGFFSIRNRTNGSWFIQAFCRVIQEDIEKGHPQDLLSMMTRYEQPSPTVLL